MIVLNTPKGRFCVNCVHHKPDTQTTTTRTGQFDKCHRPEKISPVTGRPVLLDSFCENQRQFDHLCGQAAIYFSNKETSTEEKELDKIPGKCYTGIVEKIVCWFKK